MRLLPIEDDELVRSTLERDLQRAVHAVDCAADGVRGEFLGSTISSRVDRFRALMSTVLPAFCTGRAIIETWTEYQSETVTRELSVLTMEIDDCASKTARHFASASQLESACLFRDSRGRRIGAG